MPDQNRLDKGRMTEQWLISERCGAMHIVDKIQEPDLKIIRALYNDWKETNKGNLSFDADSCSLQSVVKGAGLPENEVKSHLESLQGFAFVKLEGERVKLLPSGIKYAQGQFDKIN